MKRLPSWTQNHRGISRWRTGKSVSVLFEVNPGTAEVRSEDAAGPLELYGLRATAEHMTVTVSKLDYMLHL